MFCAGANIQMLAGSTHGHKVNFCKFTNETRNSIEDATAHSGQTWIAAVNGTAAGGGYELALACDEILLIDDRASAVSLPEVPLLAVLPGTGGLTRVVDKRFVRRDLADVFATRTEGVKGRQAVEWGLVDAIAPRSRFDERGARAGRGAGRRVVPARRTPAGVVLTPLVADVTDDGLRYEHVDVTIDRALGAAHITVHAPGEPQPATPDECWPRVPTPGCWPPPASSTTPCSACASTSPRSVPGCSTPRVTRLPCSPPRPCSASIPSTGWSTSCACYWARTLKRLDLSARTLVALVEPGSCFVGLLAELALAADRSFMLDGPDPDDTHPPAALRLTDANDGWFPMSNGLTRLATRFWGHDEALDAARGSVGKDLLAADAADLGLVTFTPDDIDWDDEVRLTLEERNSFSPDALTGMEASYRFPGPETMETKIFARLSAWQNWIFQRPNAVGPEGALRQFGSGSRPTFDRTRV